MKIRAVTTRKEADKEVGESEKPRFRLIFPKGQRKAAMDSIKIKGWIGQVEQPLPTVDADPYAHLGFKVDDIVLVRYSTFPWWPGIVIDYNTAYVPYEVSCLASQKEGKILVQFFDKKGDFAYLDPKKMQPLALKLCNKKLKRGRTEIPADLRPAFEKARELLETAEKEARIMREATAQLESSPRQVNTYLKPSKKRKKPSVEMEEVEIDHSDDSAPISPGKSHKVPKHHASHTPPLQPRPSFVSVPPTPSTASGSVKMTRSPTLNAADEIQAFLEKHGDCWDGTADGLQALGFRSVQALSWLRPDDWEPFLKGVPNTTLKLLAKTRLTTLFQEDLKVPRGKLGSSSDARPNDVVGLSEEKRIARALNKRPDGFGDEVAPALVELGFDTVNHLKFLTQFQDNPLFQKTASNLTPLALYILSTRSREFSTAV